MTEVPVVRLSGDVDLSRVATLRQDLMAMVGNRDYGIVIDLSDATYLDSAGVNLFFELAERLHERQLRLALVVPNGGLVERVVELVDLGSATRLHRSLEAAVTDVRGPA